MTRPRTASQQYEVLSAIRGFKKALKRSPTLRNLSLLTGIAISQVAVYLERLQYEDRKIRISSGKVRAIVLVGFAGSDPSSDYYAKKSLEIFTSASKAKEKTTKKIGVGPVRPIKRKDALEEAARIEAVVAKAKARETNGKDVVDSGDNVFRNRVPLRRRIRVHASRIG